MIRAAFFDVDGTLLSHTSHSVPSSTRKALALLKEKGVKCVVATGRHMLELSELPVHDIAFDAYLTLNGQLCLDNQGNVIHDNPIVGSDKEKILQLFQDRQMPVMLVEKDAMYINLIDPYVEAVQKAISTELPALGVYTGGNIYQAIAFVPKGLEDAVANQLTGCKVARWSDFAVDIISDTGGKTAGIQAYLTKNDLSVKGTIAFGDGENDIEMLEFVQIGVAMGNAPEAVKKHADHVTASVDDNGIAEALRKLNVID